MLRRTAEDGLTLVELLVSITVLGLLLGAVASVTFVAVGTASGADVRLRESGDLLLAATYFGDDVAAATSVAVGTTPRCGTDPAAVVELVGQDFSDDSSYTISTTVVSYVVRTVTVPAGTTRQLHRLACTAATTTPAYPLTPVTDVPVVRRLSATAPAVSCGSAGCAAFTQVELTLREQSGDLTYTLSGRRRTS